MDKQTYLSMLRAARRRTHRPGEKADLLQTALLMALEAQRLDFTRSQNCQWLGGVLRKRALHEARTEARRQLRDGAYAAAHPAQHSSGATGWRDFVVSLPPALRTTALLVLAGHTKAEITWLLDLTNTAFRKRISEIRQRWRRLGAGAPPGDAALRGCLSFGLLRRALLRPVT